MSGTGTGRQSGNLSPFRGALTSYPKCVSLSLPVGRQRECETRRGRLATGKGSGMDSQARFCVVPQEVGEATGEPLVIESPRLVDPMGKGQAVLDCATCGR